MQTPKKNINIMALLSPKTRGKAPPLCECPNHTTVTGHTGVNQAAMQYTCLLLGNAE